MLNAPPTRPVSASSDLPPVRFTRHDVDAMVRMGIVPEDTSTELLDGVLVHTDRAKAGDDPMSIGDDHIYTVEALSNLRSQINSDGRHVQSQQPLICGDPYEPLPDFMVVGYAFGGRQRTKARSADALCVVEVADSSYERDVGEKLVGYARAGVPQYVIINLRNRTAEVYADPDVARGTYPPPVVVAAGGTLSLRVGPAGERFELALSDVLP